MQTQTLHVKIKQALRLSQGMMQSISVLQMDSIELEAFVAGSVESNPMLEYLPPPSSHIAELQREHRRMSAGSSGTYLEELGREQYGAIAKALSVPAAQVSRAAQEIRRLDPRPGASFGKAAPPN